MVGATCGNTDGFGASDSKLPPPPPPPSLVEVMAAQIELLRHLVQEQQAIHQFLQQQHHQRRYKELNKEIKETRDVYSNSLIPLP
jgi:hypothetical protein